jgi:hypothetical protein
VNVSNGQQDGWSISVDGGATNVSTVYQINVTATYTNAAAAELEARLNRTEVQATGY